MDLKAYYKKVREVEATIATPYVVIASLETPDGGKPGTFTEVSKALAGRMIAEGRGRLATEEESAAFTKQQTAAKQAADALAAAQRMQFTLVHPTEAVQPAEAQPKPARASKD